MTTRTRTSWKPDQIGRYSRQIGWKQSKTGKLQQHKFILGTDLKEAKMRERKLIELWENFCEGLPDPKPTRPLWPDALLEIAKNIAKGIPDVPIPRGPNELQVHYAARVQRMQAKYPVLLFKPVDQYAYEVGQAALEAFEAVPGPPADFEVDNLNLDNLDALQRASKALADAGIKSAPELGIDSTLPMPADSGSFGLLRPGEPAVRRVPKPEARPINHQNDGILRVAPDSRRQFSRTPTARLHQAFNSYQEFLTSEFQDRDTGNRTPWGQNQYRQVNTLKRHHADCFLTKLDSDAVKAMVSHWRRRPNKKDESKPLTVRGCSNHLGTLIRFLKWLDESSQYDWKTPLSLGDLNTSIRVERYDHVRFGLQQVQTFSLEELKLLMRYGQPLDRLLLLLGLNCGFGAAEISTLLVGEVKLFKGHSPRELEILGCHTSDQDSFIKRVRRKSGVYGEHILFPITVEGLQWAIERRKGFPNFTPEARLVVTEKGTAFDKPTKNNNASQLIPNHFRRLLNRITNDGHEISKLSFKHLRKTATDLIKRHSDGEIAGVFDCHGSPVRTDSLSDIYSNRPFGKVFKAIRAVEEYLAPVFAEAGPNPFAQQSQAYTKRSVIDQIIALNRAGRKNKEIAAELDIAERTVYRHLSQHRESNTR